MGKLISQLAPTDAFSDSDKLAIEQSNKTVQMTLGQLKDNISSMDVAGTNITATGTTEPRTLSDRFADTVNVKDFGAKGDGVTDDTAAFQAAANAAGVGNPIYVPSGHYNKTAITNEKDYFWICGEALNSSGTNPISLTGHVEQAFNNRRLIQKTETDAGEYAEMQLSKTFNYNGGTHGNVVSNLVSTSDVSTDVADFVWGVVSVLNNSANAGENVAVYGQGNRDAGVGPVWAGVFEARDKTNTAGTGKAGTVGIEVDIFANGLDTENNRVGIDVVCGKGDVGGDASETAYGVRISPQDGDISNGTYKYGMKTTGCTFADIQAGSESYAAIQASGVNTFGVLLSGTHTVGLDTSVSSITDHAIRIAANQTISLEATGQVTLEYDATTASIILKNDAEAMRMDSNGNITAAGTINGIILYNYPENGGQTYGIELGRDETGIVQSYIDFHGTGTDGEYSSRIWRRDNGVFDIRQIGDNPLVLGAYSISDGTLLGANIELYGKNNSNHPGYAYYDADRHIFRRADVPDDTSVVLIESGNLLVGTQDLRPFENTGTSTGIVLHGSGSDQRGLITSSRYQNAAAAFNRTGDDGAIVGFYREGIFKGSVYIDETQVSYLSTSDYRLKEDIVEMEGSLDRLKALKPCNFKWKSNGTRVDGFIAHEAQEVVPEAVTGTKDSVDAEGKPEYQGIDQAKLVPLLTKALQEAVAKIEALEARVAALES